MGIMDMFRTVATTAPAQTQQTQQTQQTPTTPGNIPANPTVSTVSGDGTAPNGTVPNNVTVAEPKAPLDDYTSLWDTPVVDPNAAPNPNAPVKVDPAAIMAQAAKVDFTKVLKPETLAAINAGGEGAAKAFLESLNTVAQTVYGQAAFASTKIVEQAVEKAEARFAESIPGLIKRHSVADSTLTENPALSHPAAKPMVDAVQSQMQIKYPNATAAEIRKMTSEYFDGFMKTMSPTKDDPATKGGNKGDIDWSKFA